MNTQNLPAVQDAEVLPAVTLPALSLARSDADRIMTALAAPFDPSEVEWKPAVVSGNRAMALAYVDARVIQDRLDSACGPANWQDEYTRLDNGSVICKLSIRLGAEWICKMDVGSESDQKDGGDRTKAAFSDALKRAAVKWGIGRFLYRLPASWVDYDPQKKQFVNTPRLPDWALPPGSAPKAKAQPSAPRKTTPKGERAAEIGTLPANGQELQARVHAYQDRLIKQGLCEPGDLDAELLALAREMHWDENLETWDSGRIKVGAARIAAFAQQREAARQAPPGPALPAGPTIVAAQWGYAQQVCTETGYSQTALLAFVPCKRGSQIPTAYWEVVRLLVDGQVNLADFRAAMKIQTLAELDNRGLQRAVTLLRERNKQPEAASA